MPKINKRKPSGGFPQIKINLLSQFQELLKLNIRHDYFESGMFSKVKLRPSEGTTDALSVNGLQCRFNSEGLMLGYMFTDAYTPLKLITEPVKLSFFMEIDDVNFMNYTDLPFEFEEDKIFYFHNRELEKDETEFKNLSNDQYVTEDDQIEIWGNIINYDFDEEQYGTEVQILDAKEAVVYETMLEDGEVSCEISLLGQPEGKYSLLIDGLEEKIFYLYTGLKKIFGAIDIIIDKDDFGDYAFFESNGDIIKQEYNIHFRNRAVRWQYLLVESGTESAHKDHEIYDNTKVAGHEPIDFESVEAIEMPNGRIAHTVWSESPIPFKEKQLERCKLKTKRGKTGVDWIIDLPNASAKSNLKVNLNDKSEVYSEIIVYL